MFRKFFAFTFLALTPMLANAIQIQISNFQLWPAVDSDDTIRVVMVGVPHQNPAGCVDPDSYFVPTTYTAPIKARIYATLLTAVAMKKSVTVEIGPTCISGRPTLTRVIIQRASPTNKRT